MAGEWGEKNALKIVRNGIKELADFKIKIIDTSGRDSLDQEGIVNEDAKKLAMDMGMEVVMDKCMKKEHQKLNVCMHKYILINIFIV